MQRHSQLFAAQLFAALFYSAVVVTIVACGSAAGTRPDAAAPDAADVLLGLDAPDALLGDVPLRDATTVDGSVVDGFVGDGVDLELGELGQDTGPTDTGLSDTGPTDTGLSDTGLSDTGPTDTGPTDTGPTDTGPTDTGLSDTGPTDTGPTDTGLDAPSTTALCPGPTQPGADASVGDVPKPPLSVCPNEPPPAFFKGATPGPKTVQVQVGIVDAKGVFSPYADGDWAAMVHGAQGGFHVWAALRMTIKSAVVAQIKVQAETLLFRDCDVRGYSPSPVIYPMKISENTYLLGDKFLPGLQVRFVSGQGGAGQKPVTSKDFCNQWFRLRVSVRDVKSGAWGQTTLLLRTYDTLQPTP